MQSLNFRLNDYHFLFSTQFDPSGNFLPFPEAPEFFEEECLQKIYFSAEVELRPETQLTWDGAKCRCRDERDGFDFSIGSRVEGCYRENYGLNIKVITGVKSSLKEQSQTLVRAVRGAVNVFLVNHQVMMRRGLYVHAALGAYGDEGIIFPAHPETGKTTLSLGFETVFPQTDELVIACEDEASGGFRVGSCDTRQPGWPNATASASRQLLAMGFLGQSFNGTTISRLSKPEALRKLMTQVIDYSNDSNVMAELFPRAQRLVEQVPAYHIDRDLKDLSADEIYFRIRDGETRAC